MVVDFDKTITENRQAMAMQTGSIERFKEDIAQLQACYYIFQSLYSVYIQCEGESLN